MTPMYQSRWKENAAYNIASTVFLEPLSHQQIFCSIMKATARRRQEAEDGLVCDEVLLIHSNDEWMDCDLFFHWNLLLTQPVSIHSCHKKCNKAYHLHTLNFYLQNKHVGTDHFWKECWQKKQLQFIWCHHVCITAKSNLNHIKWNVIFTL